MALGGEGPYTPLPAAASTPARKGDTAASRLTERVTPRPCHWPLPASGLYRVIRSEGASAGAPGGIRVSHGAATLRYF